MEALYDNASHVGYGEWFSHTVTDKAKDCAFCHESKEVLCEGCEGDILGKGGSFIPQETIERVLAAPIETPTATPTATPAASPTATATAAPTVTPAPAASPTATPAATPTPTPAATPTPPGFELILAVVALAAIAYLVRRRK